MKKLAISIVVGCFIVGGQALATSLNDLLIKVENNHSVPMICYQLHGSQPIVIPPYKTVQGFFVRSALHCHLARPHFTDSESAVERLKKSLFMQQNLEMVAPNTYIYTD
jgi:hypothetical protein